MLKKLNHRAMAIIAIFVIMASMMACENSKCPEGSLPIFDANGDVIDCTLTDPGSR